MNSPYEPLAHGARTVIIDGVDAFDFPGDVCRDCRHTLDDDGRCPMCGRSQPMASAGELLVAQVERWLREEGSDRG